MLRVSLIIPALNEAASLGRLLDEVPSGLLYQLIVVDNGSTDGTAEVARASGAQVIAEPRHGYGFACAAGAASANGDILVFMDGDGSFMPAELTNLLAPLVSEQADLVLGSRMSRAGQQIVMPPHQLFGNRLFVWLLQRRFGLSITDLGPYRAIRGDLLHSLNMQEQTFGWPLEMIMKTARRQCSIVEIPITYRPRFAGQSKVGGTLRGSFLTAYRYFSVWARYVC